MAANKPNDNDDSDELKGLSSGMIVIAWVLLLGLLTLFFSNWLDKQRNPNQQIMSYMGSDGIREVSLQRNRYGHYNASGHINGYEVEFMLDTGASDIAIPAHIADQIGLQRGMVSSYRTANGNITAYVTRLDQVELGGIVMKNIRASINPSMEGEEILLGMSFLKKLEFSQSGKILTLKQYLHQSVE
jgi:aspartyl protease family protein